MNHLKAKIQELRSSEIHAETRVKLMEKAKETNPESLIHLEKEIKIYSESVAELEEIQENLKASENNV